MGLASSLVLICLTKLSLARLTKLGGWVVMSDGMCGERTMRRVVAMKAVVTEGVMRTAVASVAVVREIHVMVREAVVRRRDVRAAAAAAAAAASVLVVRAAGRAACQSLVVLSPRL